MGNHHSDAEDGPPPLVSHEGKPEVKIKSKHKTHDICPSESKDVAPGSRNDNHSDPSSKPGDLDDSNGRQPDLKSQTETQDGTKQEAHCAFSGDKSTENVSLLDREKEAVKEKSVVPMPDKSAAKSHATSSEINSCKEEAHNKIEKVTEADLNITTPDIKPILRNRTHSATRETSSRSPPAMVCTG